MVLDIYLHFWQQGCVLGVNWWHCTTTLELLVYFPSLLCLLQYSFLESKISNLNIYILRMNDPRLLCPITCIGMQNILKHIYNPIEYNSNWDIVFSMFTSDTSWHMFLSTENLFTSALGKKLCIIFLEYYGCFEIIEIPREVKDALNIDTLNHLINSQIIW